MPDRNDPIPELNLDYSSNDAQPTTWAEARQQFAAAEIYWLSTVWPNGRPHVTPMIAIWLDDALHFCTGPQERKHKNLDANRWCVITTGCNKIDAGLDIVLEGEAVAVTDEATLQRLVDGYRTKYGWEFSVGDGSLLNDEGSRADTYAVTPTTGFGFGRGEASSQTRWRFADAND